MLPIRGNPRRQHHPRKEIEVRGRGHEPSCGNTKPGSNAASRFSRVCQTATSLPRKRFCTASVRSLCRLAWEPSGFPKQLAATIKTSRAHRPPNQH